MCSAGKFLATGWLIALAIGVSAGQAAGAKKRVVTTFTIIQDMAQNVAGDAAIVESITKPGAEIHGYEPTPQDIVKTQRADLVLVNQNPMDTVRHIRDRAGVMVRGVWLSEEAIQQELAEIERTVGSGS